MTRLLRFLVLPLLVTSSVRGLPEPRIDTVFLEGVNVPGVGSVTRIEGVAINDSGQWVVQVRTNHFDTNRDTVLLVPTIIYQREGGPVAAPLGATVRAFDSLQLSDDGSHAMNFALNGTQGGFDNSGVYYDLNLVLQEGSLSTAPEILGRTYTGFDEVVIANGRQVLIAARTQDPSMNPGAALVIARVDANGVLLSESAPVRTGQTLPNDFNKAIQGFETDPGDLAFNDLGSILFIARLFGDASRNHAIYRDGVLIAQEGSPSGIANRMWRNLSDSRVDLNGTGDVVFVGELDGDVFSDRVIVKNGVKVIQTGDQLAANGRTVTRLGEHTAVKLDDLGRTLWYGQFDEPDLSRNEGIFLDQQLLVEEGVTRIDGRLVISIPDAMRTFDLSRDGSSLLFSAAVEGVAEAVVGGVFLLTLPGPYSLDPPQPGLSGQTNSLALQGGCSGVRSFLVAGIRDGSTSIPNCVGTQVLIGDPRLAGIAVAGTDGIATFQLQVPSRASGRRVFFQSVEQQTCRVTQRVEFLFP